MIAYRKEYEEPILQQQEFLYLSYILSYEQYNECIRLQEANAIREYVTQTPAIAEKLLTHDIHPQYFAEFMESLAKGTPPPDPMKCYT
jgi:hypothetical protein